MNNNLQKNEWNNLQFSLKEKARNWFIDRAIKKGIPWNEMYQENVDAHENIEKLKIEAENVDIEYPDYFLKPFHGYDDGNMNWKAAQEGEAATLSISTGYWKDVDPYTSQEWMRENITENVKNYIEDVNGIIHGFPSNALDVGCSVGISSEYLHKSYPETVISGIDLSPYFIGQAKYRASKLDLHINYLHENAEKTSFPSNFFDLIVCSFVLHELPEDATKNVVNELHRILSHNGIIAIIDMDPSYLDKQLNNNIFRKWAFESTEPHIYNYYLRDTKSMLNNVGFKSVVKKRSDPLNSVWMGVKRANYYVTKNTLSDNYYNFKVDKYLQDLRSSKKERKINYSLRKPSSV
jgi:ubiquinone/menaquinone biosynthesis C-methylase UbiE